MPVGRRLSPTLRNRTHTGMPRYVCFWASHVQCVHFWPRQRHHCHALAARAILAPSDSRTFATRSTSRRRSGQPVLFSPPSSARGFSLLEVLVTLLLVAIVTGSGMSLYANLTTETHQRGLADSCQAFFAMCRHRAGLRGMPQRTLLQGRTLVVEGSPQLRLSLPYLTDESRRLLHGLAITATCACDLTGKPYDDLHLRFLLPGDIPHTVLIHVAAR